VLDAAVTFAERVRKAIESIHSPSTGVSIQRTASFGVAAWPHPKISGPDALVKAADESLYVAKETGATASSASTATCSTRTSPPNLTGRNTSRPPTADSTPRRLASSPW